jgi:NADH-quinone oxidoreductase subunit J
VLFWVFAIVGLGAGIAMITMRNIVHAALMLVVNFLAIAALYLALQSSFLSIVQVIVYAGAIMVLFLFVIMLLGVDRDDLLVDTNRWTAVGAVVLTAAITGAVLFAIGGLLGPDARCGPQAPAEVVGTAEQLCVGLDAALEANENGAVGVVAERLFTRWTFPFEVAALLLVVATIGALVLGRRKDPSLDELEPSAPVPDEDDLAELAAAVERGTGGDPDATGESGQPGDEAEDA